MRGPLTRACGFPNAIIDCVHLLRRGFDALMQEIIFVVEADATCWHPHRIFTTSQAWCLPAVPRSIHRAGVLAGGHGQGAIFRRAAIRPAYHPRNRIIWVRPRRLGLPWALSVSVDIGAVWDTTTFVTDPCLPEHIENFAMEARGFRFLLKPR